MTAVTSTRESIPVSASRAALQGPLPGVWRVGLSRGLVELKSFFREREAMVFIFAMPAVMLMLLGTIFGNMRLSDGVTVGDLYVAGLIGGGVMATSFQNLGISIAFERERSTLKRLRGTPMPAASYFLGKVIQVIVTAIAEVALLLAVGLALYHLRLPTSLAAWWTFTWVFLLGVAACTLLGIAASSVPRSAARSRSSGCAAACARCSCPGPSSSSQAIPGTTARPRWCCLPGSSQDWCCA